MWNGKFRCAPSLSGRGSLAFQVRGKTLAVTFFSVLSVVGTGSTVRAQENRSFEIYGFADADAIVDSERVDPTWQSGFRPSKIGIDGQFGTNGQASISVKQSRFGFRGLMPADEGKAINLRFEFDLFATGADAGKTTFHLRHFYGEWGALLAGQTDSTFKDPDVFPNVIDYWGPPGYIDRRNLQIRWTGYRTATDSFAVAIENPSSDVDPGNIRLIEEYQYAEVRNDEKALDVTFRYRHNGNRGHVQAGGILRRVGYEYRVTSAEPWNNGSQTGWGVNLSAGIKTTGRDKVLAQLVHGAGIASYITDGGMDIAPVSGPTTALSAKAVPITGFLAYYDHYWNPRWSSSIGYSFTQVENTNFQSPTAYHKGDYFSVNLLATPSTNVLLGGELLFGKRTNNDGGSGDDVRFQFTVKYNFSIKP